MWVWTSTLAESAPRANEAGGESRLWAGVLEINVAQWHIEGNVRALVG